uniref:Uncharacterized protein n=2 Tax=Solanum lycopersicum TaxID=4081 RepID=A0A3Q7J983_SOLLC
MYSSCFQKTPISANFIGKIEGVELKSQMGKRKEFTVILARNIGISGYEDLSLQRRFNSTIRINPTYPHALKLISWATTNKDVLVGNVSGNFAGSSTALNKNLNHQRVISIAELAKTASVRVFHIEAEISISASYFLLISFCK